MSSPVIFLVETVGVCAMLDGSAYDMYNALVASDVRGSIGWLVVTPEPVAQLLPFSVGSNCLGFYK